MYIFALIVYCIACAIAGRVIYKKDASGFLLGLFFGPFGVVCAAILTLRKDYDPSKYVENEAERKARLDALLTSDQNSVGGAMGG